MDPVLLHILLELDCSCAGIAFPPMKAQLHPAHGWLPVLDVAAARTTERARALPAQKNPTGIQSQAQQRQEKEEDAAAAAAAAQTERGGERGGAEAVLGRAADDRGPSAEAGEAEAAASPAGQEGTPAEATPQNGHGEQLQHEGQEQEQEQGGSKRAEAAEGGEGTALEMVTCTLEDVATLTSHWDKFPEAWRASVRQACEVLRQAIVRSGLYSPGPLQHFLVGALLVQPDTLTSYT